MVIIGSRREEDRIEMASSIVRCKFEDAFFRRWLAPSGPYPASEFPHTKPDLSLPNSLLFIHIGNQII